MLGNSLSPTLGYTGISAAFEPVMWGFSHLIIGKIILHFGNELIDVGKFAGMEMDTSNSRRKKCRYYPFSRASKTKAAPERSRPRH
jgi:hypothetical protein